MKQNCKYLLVIVGIVLMTIGFVSVYASIHPEIKIINPQEGDTVSGKIIIKVHLVGYPDFVYGGGVTLFLDDKMFKKDSNPPYQWNWQTKNTSDGKHTLSSKACVTRYYGCVYSENFNFTISN